MDDAGLTRWQALSSCVLPCELQLEFAHHGDMDDVAALWRNQALCEAATATLWERVCSEPSLPRQRPRLGVQHTSAAVRAARDVVLDPEAPVTLQRALGAAFLATQEHLDDTDRLRCAVLLRRALDDAAAGSMAAAHLQYITIRDTSDVWFAALSWQRNGAPFVPAELCWQVARLLGPLRAARLLLMRADHPTRPEEMLVSSVAAPTWESTFTDDALFWFAALGAVHPEWADATVAEQLARFRAARSAPTQQLAANKLVDLVAAGCAARINSGLVAEVAASVEASDVTGARTSSVFCDTFAADQRFCALLRPNRAGPAPATRQLDLAAALSGKTAPDRVREAVRAAADGSTPADRAVRDIAALLRVPIVESAPVTPASPVHTGGLLTEVCGGSVPRWRTAVELANAKLTESQLALVVAAAHET